MLAKSVLLASGFIVALSFALSPGMHAQAAQSPPIVNSPVTGRPPGGTATGVTDRQGSTNEPAGTSGTKEPPNGSAIDKEKQTKPPGKTAASAKNSKTKHAKQSKAKHSKTKRTPPPTTVG